jgi:hypothetical protein
VARALLGRWRMMGKVWGLVAGIAPALFFAVALSNCKSDDEARLQATRPGMPLAVGAYHRLTVGDACAGGGKISVCGTQYLVTLDELSSQNPDIAEVVLAADAPASSAGVTHYVLGIAPGKATLTFRGTFDDGSVRSGELDLEVRKANRVRMSTTCTGTETSEVVTKPGGGAHFHLRLFDRETELAGLHPDAIIPIEGVMRSTAFDSDNKFTWAAPSEPVAADIHSGIVAGRVGTLRAYGPADVSDIVVDSANGSSLTTWTLGPTRISATVKVRGVVPCDVAPVVFRTETPAVCSGPEGAESWPGEDEWGGFAEMKGEGTCRISASADGVRFFRPASFRFFVVEPPGTEKFDGFNEPCAVEGSTSCTYGDNSQVTLCREGRWATKEQCGPTRTCDARDPSLAGCVAGGPCSECRAMR